ncbi:MAG: CHASE2 domain-containing sensor protein [Gammaproteobacteria bacterium]|jgi:CHASE2 domain-containing sensor protein
MTVMACARLIVLRPRRYALIPLVALLFTVLIAQTPTYRQIALWVQDAVHAITAQRLRFEGVLVVDVDELTMSELESSVGAWPYPRRLYAGVVAYLISEGARAVVFDMLLVEQRDGDDELSRALSRALSRHRNVWLAARGQNFSLARQPGYFDQLQRYAWPVADDIPARSWPDMLLPTPALGEQAGAAVISVSADDDGVLRAIAPFHRAYGVAVPAMPLAVAYQLGEPPAVSVASHVLSIGEHRWPLDAQGRIVIQIPRNRDFLRVINFAQVLAAAAGNSQPPLDASQIRGRTVFLGSSAAILGDYARLPIHGRTAGLAILALRTRFRPD